MAGAWCTLACLLPLAVLLPVYLHVQRSAAILVVLVLLMVLGVAWLLISLRHTLVDGVIRKPPALPRTRPLVGSSAGDKQPSTVAVKNLILIINLHSGKKKGAEVLAAVRHVLESEYSINVTVRETEFAGHTREYGATLDLAGVDALCVCGGDGSIHELINGMYERSASERESLFGGNFALGFIPAGSGNSLCHDLGSINPIEVARRIGRGEACWMDVNEVHHGVERPTLSMNTVAWGLVGDVGVVAEGWRCLGPSRYDLCALWGVAKAQAEHLQVKSGHSVLVNATCTTAFVNHTQYFGQGLRAAPHARLDDGLMDVVVVQPMTRDDMLKLFQLLPDGNHVNDPSVVSRQLQQAVFKPRSRRGVLNIDGEIYPRNGPFTVTVLPKLMRIFVPVNALALGPGVKHDAAALVVETQPRIDTV